MVLTTVFILGIIVGDVFPQGLYFSLLFSLFLFTLLCFLFISKGKTFTRFTSLFLLLLLLTVSYINYVCLLPENQRDHITNMYLKGDQIVGEIISYTPTKGKYIKTEFRVRQLIRENDTLLTKGKVVLFVKDQKRLLKAYDVCLIQAELTPIRNKLNPGEFDAESFWKHKGFQLMAFANEENCVKVGSSKTPWYFVFSELRSYFSKLLEEHLSGDELGVAKGLILGDRSSLDSEITAKFGNTGAMHVLAVSGLHIGILVQILTMLFGLFRKWISKNRAIMIVLLIVWSYALLTGFSASVVRSALMFSILSGSKMFERNISNYNALAFSAFVILAWNPHFLFDIGFQLSYLAMLGIFMFYQPLSKVWVSGYWIGRKVVEGTMVGVAAQIMTVPFTLYYFHQFPNYFILTNIGLMFFSFLILALGLAVFTFNWFSLIGKFLAFALSLSLLMMLLIISVIDALPGAVAYGYELNFITVTVLFGLILLFFFSLQSKKEKLLYLSLALTLVLSLSFVWDRYQHIHCKQICFFQADFASFVVKLNDRLHVFYADKRKDTKKIKFLTQNFQKLYPGKISYYEISSVKRTVVQHVNQRIFVERKKGGYEIKVNQQAYFLVTSLKNTSTIKDKIYSAQLSVRKKHSLKEKGISFVLHDRGYPN